jgi:hypothetical protein
MAAALSNPTNGIAVVDSMVIPIRSCAPDSQLSGLKKYGKAYQMDLYSNAGRTG